MRTQLKILILLIDVLVVLAIYAMSPVEWTIADSELRKVKFLPDAEETSVLAADAPGDAAAASSGAAPAAPASKGAATTAAPGATAATAGNPSALSSVPPQPAAAPDSVTQRFLFFGDSMLEGLSRRLCDYVAENGYEQRTVLWYSSTSEKWATTNTLDYYIREVQPTFILCCLCSNELFVRDLDRRDKFIATIVRKMGNIPFVWISPPNWKDDTGINDLIIKHVGMSRYFDSRHLTLARGRDKAHPTFEAAAHWFDLVAEWLESDQTAHPIVMKRPTKKVKWSHVTMLQPNDPGK